MSDPYTDRPDTRRCYCGRVFYDVFDDFQCLACSGTEAMVIDDLCAQGFQEGLEEGFERAVEDTLARRAPDDYSFPQDNLPYMAWANRNAYSQTYSEGYRIGYKQVYKRHAPLIKQLERFHAQRVILAYLANRFQHRAFFEPRVLPMIRELL